MSFKDFQEKTGRYTPQKHEIVVFEKTIESANIITVQAGTNCPQGGDTGHGGRTLFGITDQASTDMRVSIDGGPFTSVNTVTLLFGGDCEHQTFIEAMKYALSILERPVGGTLLSVE